MLGHFKNRLFSKKSGRLYYDISQAIEIEIK